MPHADHQLDESNRNAADEMDAVVRHSAGSNGFGAPEVALEASRADPRVASAQCQTVMLARHEVLCLRDECGALVCLHEGVAWLTQERAPVDVMLLEGE